MHAADRRLAASLASGNAARAAQNCRFWALWGLSGGAYTHGRHPNRNNATVWGVWAHELALRPHKVAHARTWRLGTVGACGVACLHQGGHVSCKVQRRMRGRAHRHTTRHTTRCGALGRIARRRSAPSGVVGFRQRRAGCPKLQILGPLGAFGAAPTRTGDIRTAKTRRCGAYGPMSSRLGHTRWVGPPYPPNEALLWGGLGPLTPKGQFC